MKKILNIINTEMKSAGIDYHFQKNKKSPPTYPYFVGELIPVVTGSEDGMKEFTLILDGFTRKTAQSSGDLLELLDAADVIEAHFPVVGGFSTVVNNQAIVIHFVGCQPVESGDEQLNKIEITLQIKSWKGSI